MSGEPKGLCAVLREWAGSYEEGSFDTEAGLMIEAASAIEALRERLAEVEGDRERWAEQANKEDECRQMWQARAEAAEEANNRLREALEPFLRIANRIPETVSDTEPAWVIRGEEPILVSDFRLVARALDAQTEPGEQT